MNKKILSADDILSALSEIASADAYDFLDIGEDGTVSMKPLSKIPLKKRHAAALIKNTSAKGGIEIKLYDKMKALELLGKHYDLFGGDLSSEEDNLSKLDSIFCELLSKEEE